MCTECLTIEIRELVPRHVEDEGGNYFTLRAGRGLRTDLPLIICAVYDEVAGFEFSSPDGATHATLQIIDPDGWNLFIRSYARELCGHQPESYSHLVKELEREAVSLFPKLGEWVKQSLELWVVSNETSG